MNINTDINNYPLDNKVSVISFTISKDNWTSKTNTVEFFDENSTSRLYFEDSSGYIAPYNTQDLNVISSSKISISKLETNKITFKCETVPDSDINMVLYYNTGYTIIPGDGFLPLTGGTMTGDIKMKPINGESLTIGYNNIFRGNTSIILASDTDGGQAEIEIYGPDGVEIFANNYDSVFRFDDDGFFKIEDSHGAYINSNYDGALAIAGPDGLRLETDTDINIENNSEGLEGYINIETQKGKMYFDNDGIISIKDKINNSYIEFDTSGQISISAKGNLTIEGNDNYIKGITHIKDRNNTDIIQINTDSVKLRNSKGTNLLLENNGIVSELQYHQFTNKNGGDVALILDRNGNANWKILNTGGILKFQNDYTTTKGEYFDVLTLSHNTGDAKFKNNVTANKFIGSLQGNADTATKLSTSVTINGTSFDGSANITTANWGTSRNITIGNSTKAINGSTNVTWTLDDIGAATVTKIANGTDIDTIKTTGFYSAGGSNKCENKPAGIDAFGLIVYMTASGWIAQDLISSNNLTNKRFTRQFNNNSWSDWVCLPTFTKTPESGKIIIASDVNGGISSSSISLPNKSGTVALLDDLAGSYTHPSYTPQSSGLYKITVDNLGHVSAAATVTKADITALGIPGTDTNTTYNVFNATTNGLVPAPTSANTTKFLRGDGSWAEVAVGDHNHDDTYLKLSGGTITGTLDLVESDSSVPYIKLTNNDGDDGTYTTYIEADYISCEHYPAEESDKVKDPGWEINADGSAYFKSLTLKGSSSDKYSEFKLDSNDNLIVNLNMLWEYDLLGLLNKFKTAYNDTSNNNIYVEMLTDNEKKVLNYIISKNPLWFQRPIFGAHTTLTDAYASYCVVYNILGTRTRIRRTFTKSSRTTITYPNYAVEFYWNPDTNILEITDYRETGNVYTASLTDVNQLSTAEAGTADANITVNSTPLTTGKVLMVYE